MITTRRAAIALGLAAGGSVAVRHPARAAFVPRPGEWRRYEITTRVALPDGGGPARVWLPMPSVSEPPWMRVGPADWTTEGGVAQTGTDPVHGARFLAVDWPADAKGRVVELRTRADARDRQVELDRPRSVPPLSPAARALYTAPTDLIPTDGIVRETADRVVQGAQGDLDKAQRIYDWVVENSARNPETRGCGLGDIASMLEMGDLSGKCADLNALFVGLARAAGLLARDVYGLRVAPSRFGYASLGAGSADVTRAQHCRAEVFLDAFGWVPADPADVRKVMLEEPPGDLPLDHPKVRAAREALFGAWEGNWLGFNFAHDVALPGATQGPVPFLMYPEAEIAGRRRDPLSPDHFAYTITARELG